MARILLAEDSSSVRVLLTDELERLGHRVRAETNGEDAWTAFQADSFDLVITDWQMPRVSGDELVRRMRKGKSAVPVIVQTSDPAGARLARLEALEQVRVYEFTDLLQDLDRAVQAALAAT